MTFTYAAQSRMRGIKGSYHSVNFYQSIYFCQHTQRPCQIVLSALYQLNKELLSAFLIQLWCCNPEKGSFLFASPLGMLASEEEQLSQQYNCKSRGSLCCSTYNCQYYLSPLSLFSRKFYVLV